MARTYRNRHSAPKGHRVQDGGTLTRRGGGDPVDQDYRAPFRTPLFKKERKCSRKAHYRSYRAKAKDHLRHGNWDEIPRFRKTSGWYT